MKDYSDEDLREMVDNPKESPEIISHVKEMLKERAASKSSLKTSLPSGLNTQGNKFPKLIAKFANSANFETAAERSESYFKKPYIEDDIWRESGGLFDETLFNTKLTSITNPEEYKRQRDAALENVKKQTVESYKSTYAMSLAAGASKDNAKERATQAAKSVRRNGMETMKSIFPSDIDGDFMSAARKKANQFVK